MEQIVTIPIACKYTTIATAMGVGKGEGMERWTIAYKFSSRPKKIAEGGRLSFCYSFLLSKSIAEM